MRHQPREQTQAETERRLRLAIEQEEREAARRAAEREAARQAAEAAERVASSSGMSGMFSYDNAADECRIFKIPIDPDRLDGEALLFVPLSKRDALKRHNIDMSFTMSPDLTAEEVVLKVPWSSIAGHGHRQIQALIVDMARFCRSEPQSFADRLAALSIAASSEARDQWGVINPIRGND